MKDEILLPQRMYNIVKEVVRAGKVNADEVAKAVGKKKEDIMRDLAELEAKELIKTSHVRKFFIRLTASGINYLISELPEEKLVNALQKMGGCAGMKDLKSEAGLTSKEFSAALGILRKLGLISIARGTISLNKENKEALNNFQKAVKELKENLQHVIKGIASEEIPKWIGRLRHRGMIEIEVKKKIVVEPTSKLIEKFKEGKVKKAKVITKVTPEIIASSAWENAIIKEFDLGVDVPIKKTRRIHPYIQFLNYVREVLIGLGFIEVKGPHIEPALWNFDLLFVPQYHPSRRETDVFYVRNELKTPDQKIIIKKVKEIHESVLKYRWRLKEALKIVLRTHTTPVSLRTINKLGKGEYRAFSLDRVFRPDTPDPTHLMEFHQLEGIIVGEEVAFSNLLGFFKEFARRLDLGKVRFRPAYFPFTEPSVEGYIKHPKLGWIEVFPGGMFRKEVLKPFTLPEGYKVAAWGIGIDRIAMMVLGLDDIRDLYTNKLELIESLPVPKRLIK